MFDAIKSNPERDNGTRATLELPEMGLKYFVEFHPKEDANGWQVFTQLLTRVHAVDPKRMVGIPVPHAWSTCLRYNVVVMDQHLPRSMTIDCSTNQ